jgi:hypothetical protein
MQSLTIISDNHYFMLGLDALFNTCETRVLSPQQIIGMAGISENSVCLVYISDTEVCRRVCRIIKNSTCELFFFVDIVPACSFSQCVSSRIWDARSTLYDIQEKIRRIRSFISEKLFSNLTGIKMRHIVMAAKGLQYYKSWILHHLGNTGTGLSQYRTLVHAVGINNVSVHTFFSCRKDICSMYGDI